MALVVTNAGAGIDALNLAALQVKGGTYPSSPNSSGGSGTIYLESWYDKPGRGTVRVANFNRTGNPITEVAYTTYAVPGEADRSVFRVRDGAKMRMLNDFMVGDIWLETANAVLDLGGYTLTVRSREHPLGPGSVQNYGQIIWLPDIPRGTVYFAK